MSREDTASGGRHFGISRRCDEPHRLRASIGIISGRVTDPAGLPVFSATVEYRGTAVAAEGSQRCDTGGLYTLPLLPPGRYTVRVTAPGYQDAQIDDLDLPVAALVNLPISLRPLQDLWEQNQPHIFVLPETQIVKFYGPDVDTSRIVHLRPPDPRHVELEAAMSDVVSRDFINDLPLAGRNVYSVLLVEPAVAAGVTASRGVGLAAAGQRPSSSNFLLDGLENNQSAITGPLFPLPPESIQEYRVSTNNYSPEFGRTSGYLANAVTKAGTANWHGLAYVNAKNSSLNANDFQSHARGVRKASGHEIEPGAQAGGPLQHNRLFLSLAADLLHSAGVVQAGPQVFVLPTQTLYDQLAAQPAATAGRQLLSQYHPIVIPAALGDSLVTPVTLVPPVTLNQEIGIARIDFNPARSRNKLLARVAVARSSRPDYTWSPYSAFTSGLESNVVSIALAGTTAFSRRLVNEARAGWNSAGFDLGDRNPVLPRASSGDGVILPGPLSSIAYGNRNRSWEFSDNLLWTAGRQILKVGGGMLAPTISLDYHFADRGLVGYADILSFLADQPSIAEFTVSRQAYSAGQLSLPPTAGHYRHRQFDLFAEDSLRVTRRLTVNAGVRVDDFASPTFSGQAAPQVVLGAGGDMQSRIQTASLQFTSPYGDRVYNARNPNFAGRGGFAFNPGARDDLVLRGGYGIFFDRPFDNVWLDMQSNAWQLATFDFAGSFDPRKGIPALISELHYKDIRTHNDFSYLTLIQPNLRSAYAQSFFLSAQQRLRRNWFIEVNGLGSLGRLLLTNDIVNRNYSNPVALGDPLNPGAQLNGGLAQLQYRANQGASDYSALSVVARRVSARMVLQAAYTWSHSIDNQSEPLIGDFTDLRPDDPAPRPAAFHGSFTAGWIAAIRTSISATQWCFMLPGRLAMMSSVRGSPACSAIGGCPRSVLSAPGSLTRSWPVRRSHRSTRSATASARTSRSRRAARERY